jgi:REP-associated tyrosine transposase
MYKWRRMTEEQRVQAMKERRFRHYPQHSLPHWNLDGEHQYLVTSACYEHALIIGKHSKRMTDCEEKVLEACREHALEIYAWCILPNHYHVLVKTSNIGDLRKALGKFHGRSSFAWNGEDDKRGRQVWHNCLERAMKTERHLWASLNYVHHNPVHHGYARQWQDWPWSSAADFLARVGREKAAEVWRAYPIKEYGQKWDIY